MPGPGLTFGTINLIGADGDIAANGYQIDAMATDTNWGNPVPIIQRIKSWLQDGSLAKIKGFDNRTINVQVSIIADDSAGLALGSKNLELETKKTNLLTYTPPDGVGAPTVFPVVFSYTDNVWDDEDEALRIRRTFNLKIEAKPFVRSSILTTVSLPAPTGTQSFTTVDDCTSTTGWAGTATTGTPVTTTSGGSVILDVSNMTAGSTTVIRLARTGLSINLSTTPYLRVRMGGTPPDPQAGKLPLPVFSATVSGVTKTLPIAVQEGSVYWLDTSVFAGTTLTAIDGSFTFKVGPGSAVYRNSRIKFDDIVRSNFLGTQSTNRQLSRIVPVAGSERTEGNLSISDAANGLGNVLIYTCKTAAGQVQPNLRQFLTSGNTQTGEILSISGFNSALSAVHQFDIPASQMAQGGYSLMARVKHPSTAGNYSLNWAAKSLMGSTTDAGQSGTKAITLGNNVYDIFELGTVTLPTRKIGPSGFVRIELSGTSGLVVDEAWLFNLDTGDLTWVNVGAGTPAAGGVANRLWLDAATLENPKRDILVGTAADRSDSMYADVIWSKGKHEFTPDAVNVFSVTEGSTASLLELSHYAYFGSYVVDP